MERKILETCIYKVFLINLAVEIPIYEVQQNTVHSEAKK